MVESFSGNNKDSSFIEGTKIMENFSDNNENGSSIFQGKIREQDFSAEQKLNELKAAIEELDRQDLLRRLECERQASSCVDKISSQAELHIKDDEGYFDCEKPLRDFWNFFESLFNLFEVNVDDPEIYQMLKEKKEKNLIAAIMKFLRNKLKELIKKIFTGNLDLSWDKRLDKEIKELQEKLNRGGLSPEEEMAILERLEALRGLKLKLQMAVTGWIVTMFAEMFGVELAAIVEASTEETAKAEDKKAERTSLKEENKEVHKDVEIKVDEREKPKVPVSLFDVSPGFVRPVVLSKPELDLLPEPLKIPMDRSHEKDSKVQNQKVEKDKKAEPEPKVAVCPPAPKTATNTTGTRRREPYGCDSDWRRYSNSSTYVSTPNQPTTGSVSNGKALEQSNQASGSAIEKSASNIGAKKQSVERLDFTVGFWNGPENKGSVNDAQAKVSSGITDNGKSSASSASDAKENPKSKFTDVLKERAARGNGNTPSR